MNCPACNTGDAYVGFVTVECVNDRCLHFNQKLYDTCARAGVVPVKVTVDLGAAKKTADEHRYVWDEIRQLAKALEAGSYNAGDTPSAALPPFLTMGSSLNVEDLSAVMKNVTFRGECIVFRGKVRLAAPLKFVPITFDVDPSR